MIVGVGVTMDNMLYIIAGLVLILLVAVMVLRKNKTQKLPTQRPMQAGKNAAANAAVSTHKAERSSTAQGDPNNANKFDSITIAQRFMDQQSYDKAIETLERGLIEKPQDNQILLKLLNVYALTNQPDGFNRIYDDIKAHSDSATVKQADELKSLLAEEENQAAARVAPVVKTNSSEFGSLDFDLPTTQTIENSGSPAVVSSSEQVESFDDVNDFKVTNDSSPTNKNMDDTFDLMLGDLETDSGLETDEIYTDLETSDSDLNDLQLAAAATNVAPVSQSDSIDNDFNFDFESPAQSAPIDAAADNSSLEEISLDDDDFVLDFADLETDTDFNSSVDTNAAIESPVQTSEYDFTLSLDSNDLPTIIEDASIENSSVTPTTSPTFDDNSFIDDGIFIDDNFDATLNLPAETTPVELEEDYAAGADDLSSGFEDRPKSDTESASDGVSAETPVDFASRFAADFDFVKTLDSNQVTLDLAGQYLQLGEYDSAKRLLNEVITQGNDEQKNQAQALLARTA